MDLIFHGSCFLLLFVFMKYNTIYDVVYVIILIKTSTICAALQVKKLSKAGKGKDSVVVHVMILS